MEQATANLGRRVRRSAHRLGLPALWRWWMAELAPLVPRRLRTAAQRRSIRPVLIFGGDEAVLQVPRTTNGAVAYAEVARIALTGDHASVTNAGRAAIDSLTRIAYGGAVAAARLAIVLPHEQVLRKTLTLPAMVEDSLMQTLAYDIDRHTPFKADDVYFDAAIVGRDPVRKEIRVDWVAALRSVVDQARSRAEAWGATVVGIWPAGPDAAAPVAGSRLNLLPAAERPDAAGWRRWQIVAPALILLALALIAVALPLWQKRTHVIALMQVVEQARVQAGASDALRQQLDQMTGEYNFALQRKYAFPSTVQVLEDVTRILPDDTWLTQLEVKTPAKGKDPHRDIQLRGESANAGRLVSLLEESKLFGEAAPRSPTTKIQPGPGEIFDLGAQLKPLPLPPMVQLASLPRTAPPVEALVPKPGSPAPAAGPGNAPASTPPAAAPATKAANPAPSAATSGTQVSAEAGPEESETAPGAMRDPRAAPAGATIPAGASAAGATPAAGTRARGDPRTRGSQEATQ